MSPSCFTLASYSGSAACVAPARYALAQWRAVRTNTLWLFLYCDATTASCGSSGSSGGEQRLQREQHGLRSVMAAAHWSLRMSRHMAPVTLLMLGCQILVRNLTLGGLNGYVLGNLDLEVKSAALVRRIWWSTERERERERQS